MISPQHVKPFVKGNKTDRNDAEAICEAAQRPNMRFVSIKEIEQQDIQALLRIREQLIEQRTALCNQIRGLVAEYGVIVKKGVAALRKALPDLLEDGENELSHKMRTYLQRMRKQFMALDEEIQYTDLQAKEIYTQSEEAQRIAKIEGVGPIIAVCILSLGRLNIFKKGRNFSAFLGLVPKESSSGNKRRLLGISKRGNLCLRKLLVQGAKSVLMHVEKKTDRKSLWLKNLKERKGSNYA